MRNIALSSLLLVLTVPSMASDLSDATDFLTAAALSCGNRDGKTTSIGFDADLEFITVKLSISKMTLPRKKDSDSSDLQNQEVDWVHTARLSELAIPDEYTVLECSGSSCIRHANIQNRYTVLECSGVGCIRQASIQLINGEEVGRQESVLNKFGLGLCDEVSNRAYKALSDAIRLSGGGKHSKY